MKLFLLVSATLTLGQCLLAQLSERAASHLVEAIYHAEGGTKAVVPFGILSVRVSGYDEARRVCWNTVVNNHRRWIESGCPGDFIRFLGRRYCPPSVCQRGHENWVRNVSFFYHRAIRRSTTRNDPA